MNEKKEVYAIYEYWLRVLVVYMKMLEFREKDAIGSKAISYILI